MKWSSLVCGDVGYELFPAVGRGGGKLMSEEEATNWIRRLAANVDILCFEVVGVSLDHLSGVEWLNKVGREARDGNVILDMQNVDEVRTIRGIMEDPRCLWLQVDVCGGWWAPSDTTVVVNDGYVTAGVISRVGVDAGGAVALPPAGIG